MNKMTIETESSNGSEGDLYFESHEVSSGCVERFLSFRP